MFLFVVSSINKSLIITKILLLVRRKSSKLFRRRRNEKSLRTTGLYQAVFSSPCTRYYPCREFPVLLKIALPVTKGIRARSVLHSGNVHFMRLATHEVHQVKVTFSVAA